MNVEVGATVATASAEALEVIVRAGKVSQALLALMNVTVAPIFAFLRQGSSSMSAIPDDATLTSKRGATALA